MGELDQISNEAWKLMNSFDASADAALCLIARLADELIRLRDEATANRAGSDADTPMKG